MNSISSTSLLEQIRVRCPCRQAQLQQLAVFYNEYLPFPPILVAYGLEDTGRLSTILTLLDETKTLCALVKSRECLSQRHLLTKIFAACLHAIGREDISGGYDRVDSLNSLCVNLQRLMRDSTKRLVLVLDGIDKQKGASYALYPALARLGDEIPALHIILISSSARPLQLHRSGVPYVQFPPYTRSEAIQLLVRTPPPLQPESLPAEFPTVATATLSYIYASYVAAVYDTLTTHTLSSSIPAFRRQCETLWPRFIWPMLAGESIPSRSQKTPSTMTWDFARLLARNRSLFQHEGEKALVEKLDIDSTEAWTFNDLLRNYIEQSKPQQVQPLISQSLSQSKSRQKLFGAQLSLLKQFSMLVLLSAYLASHTQPKHDIILFSRLSSSSSHKRRYLASTLNRSKIRKTPTKPKSHASSTANGDDGTDMSTTTTPTKRSKTVTAGEASATPNAEKEKTHRSSRLLFDKTSSIPKPFTLERVIAILRAIHPDGIARSKSIADRVYVELAELERLRLVVRLGIGAGGGAGPASGVSGEGAGGGSRGTDDGVLEEKWRVNVSREIVVEMGRGWGLGVEGWEID